MYKKVCNNPSERAGIFVPWVYWDGAFSAEELEEMCEYFSKNGVERGTTVGHYDKETNQFTQKPNEEVRVSNTKFYMYDPENEILLNIFNKFNYIIDAINERCFNMDLNGYESVQYTEYDSTEKGKYDFHMDTIFGYEKPMDMLETRKLSLVLLLNDEFEGGAFQFNKGLESKPEEIEMKKGRILLFPSFLIHRVTPVTKGIRKSLVTWIEGPKFK
jgi:PKHD-type hydroxylase